jgi:hypothetical protein
MDFGIQLLVLVWIVLFAASLQWGRTTNRGASVVTWLGLTFVTWWVEFALAFIALHTILFALGREAAIVLAVATLVVMAITPAAWALALRAWNHSRSVHG